MPWAPKRPCRWSGCSELTHDGFCPPHLSLYRATQDRQRDGAGRALYRTSRWRKASQGNLERHPLCVVCLAKGITTAATVTDHKVPHKGDPVLFWDPANWQSMCKPDHDVKTATEDGGFGRTPTGGKGG